MVFIRNVQNPPQKFKIPIPMKLFVFKIRLRLELIYLNAFYGTMEQNQREQ